MKKPTTVKTLEDLGRVRLSTHFFMRDFLYSEISQIEGIANIPDFPDRAVEAGRQLCEQLLEPLQDRFGRIAIRSAYRSPSVNAKGAENGNQYSCATNEKNYASHIWDYPDEQGHLGATACIVVPALLPWYEQTGDWTPLAWWIHDNLPYASQFWFPKLAAFNLRWSANPATLPSISTYVRNPHTGDRTALVKDGVAACGLEERKLIVGPWLASLK
ncbi:TPA: peptidase M15 [Pseudomonas aeruginosa]|uniref:peptidase M15 n=1 Tax=Pseudomonas TaxID=286 RepID=UPI001A2438B7|nr:peptidase M15 [Pseudomonas aeruginosa]MBH3537644.1 peptidase M15 [Pseudomonas aeruginosa]MBX6553201.1 peptidase M15 [Pseudomonas aeruginosa]MBX6585281.1 peptidase M15 [Pseudomonas aeruginosa]MBX6615419.1 peptidase M15 [Pseudomonas aeruginosa]MBX6878700.1 peptidase M15 [Pseudomonas aeruginosa]